MCAFHSRALFEIPFVSPPTFKLVCYDFFLTAHRHRHRGAGPSRTWNACLRQCAQPRPVTSLAHTKNTSLKVIMSRYRAVCECPDAHTHTHNAQKDSRQYRAHRQRVRISFAGQFCFALERTITHAKMSVLSSILKTISSLKLVT